MKGIIIYQGKYGATKQYAEWLSQETMLPVESAKNIGGIELKEYDFFILGSSVYIGQLTIKKWLQHNLCYLVNKKVFFFQVAGAPISEKAKRIEFNRSAPAEIMDRCQLYFLHGKLIKSQLSWWDRFMLKMGARMTKNPDDKKNMLTDYNDVRKEYITDIARAINIYMMLPKPIIAA
jgi:menaquinone-dependent protoporphyrinogen IX oxidase